MIEKFAQLSKNRHEYAKGWKAKTGGKIMGYFCTYVPEEILYAANVLPVRVLGSHEPEDVTEPYIYKMYCPFCRDCLAQGLHGKYKYLDGLMSAHSCTHIRQAYSSWLLHVGVPFDYYFSMPQKVQSPRAKPFLISELTAFKAAVEKWTGKKLSDADLDKGIEILNTSRRLMRQIYEMRKADNPPITGLQAMQMVVSSQMTDKQEHNQILQQVIKELSQKQGKDPGIRLMLLGSEDDDSEFIDMVESVGATVVVDDHCTGSRYFWNEVVPQKDRLSAIADRYLQRPVCPQKDIDQRYRWEYISKLVDDWKVQGVILIQQKFCDPHEFDIPYLVKRLKEEKNIPSLFLEFDVTVPLGQFRTRVEAFLEILQMEALI